MREVIFSADDFGLTDSVNEAVEQANRVGRLTQASLMVAAPAAADAVRRANALPKLNVGLHLVLVDGDSLLGHDRLPTITGPDGRFSTDQARLGVLYFFSHKARRELRAEIEAQFAAFAATGLTLHHADAHKHMHLHPTVARMMIEAGRKYGLKRLRIPGRAARRDGGVRGDGELWRPCPLRLDSAASVAGAGVGGAGSGVRHQMVRAYDARADREITAASARRTDGNLHPSRHDAR